MSQEELNKFSEFISSGGLQRFISNFRNKIYPTMLFITALYVIKILKPIMTGEMPKCLMQSSQQTGTLEP